MSSAIAERVLELVADFPIDVRSEPLQADGRLGDVATQPLNRLALVGLTGDRGLQ